MAKTLLFLTVLLTTACTSRTNENVLRVFTWSEYFNETSVAEFERETNSKVKLDYFASNEEMLAKVQLMASGSESYDLLLPSDYMIGLLKSQNLLAELDHGLIPRLKELEPKAMQLPYDPGLQFSVPMAEGTTGIAWNKNVLPDLPVKLPLRWKDIFENPALKGQVTLLNDSKEVLQAGLLALGKDPSKATDADIEAAFTFLASRKNQLKGFLSETRPALEGNQCGLCMAYSGDVRSVAKEKPGIQFLRPAEGQTVWTDNFAIPLKAKNKELAHAFINFMLEGKRAKAFTERTGYKSYSTEANRLIGPALARDTVVFPGTGLKLFFLEAHPKRTQTIERLWAHLRSK
jgi:spermidine/putrescine transport system substrate-binding protein